MLYWIVRLSAWKSWKEIQLNSAEGTTTDQNCLHTCFHKDIPGTISCPLCGFGVNKTVNSIQIIRSDGCIQQVRISQKLNDLRWQDNTSAENTLHGYDAHSEYTRKTNEWWWNWYAWGEKTDQNILSAGIHRSRIEAEPGMTDIRVRRVVLVIVLTWRTLTIPIAEGVIPINSRVIVAGKDPIYLRHGEELQTSTVNRISQNSIPFFRSTTSGIITARLETCGLNTFVA